MKLFSFIGSNWEGFNVINLLLVFVVKFMYLRVRFLRYKEEYRIVFFRVNK